MKTIDKAKLVISRIQSSDSVIAVKNDLASDENEWFRISAKASALFLADARKKRDEDKKNPNIGTTSNEEIDEILRINEKLSEFALCIPSLLSMSHVRAINLLLHDLPRTEEKLLGLIENATIKPKIRAMQNVGRIRHFTAFKEFSLIIEAATLSYFRANYASAYLTLVPVIEGIILRWSGYFGSGEKPEFEVIRRFFNVSHTRQPCPWNPLFHEVFSKACHKIINDHLYKPSGRGAAYSEFNRHQASHLLRNAEFATRGNCIRLFLLLDTMAEIYLFETWCHDPRLEINDEDIHREVTLYRVLQAEAASENSAEKILLKKNEA